MLDFHAQTHIVTAAVEAELQRLCSENLVKVRTHPEFPELEIWNYTPKAGAMPMAQWSPVLQACRGLVLENLLGDETPAHRVIARGFNKFWNLEQHENVPTSEYEIWEKLDGVLGIVFQYRNRKIAATRGSFQSKWAKLLQKAVNGLDWAPTKNYTYLFEIIGPQAQIVLSYPDDEFVLLSVLDLQGRANKGMFELTREIGPFSTVSPKQMTDIAGEGVVLFWPKENFRVKVKLPAYVEHHRIIFGTSTLTIWHELSRGATMDEINRQTITTPPLFRKWRYNRALELHVDAETIVVRAVKDYLNAPKGTRKDFAIFAKTCRYPSVLFALYDGHAPFATAWKLVKPKKAERYMLGGEEEDS